MTSNPTTCSADGGTSGSSCDPQTNENTPCSVTNSFTNRRPARRKTRLFEGVERLIATEEKPLQELTKTRKELEDETTRKRKELDRLATQVEERIARVVVASSLCELSKLRSRQVPVID